MPEEDNNLQFLQDETLKEITEALRLLNNRVPIPQCCACKGYATLVINSIVRQGNFRDGIPLAIKEYELWDDGWVRFTVGDQQVYMCPSCKSLVADTDGSA